MPHFNKSVFMYSFITNYEGYLKSSQAHQDTHLECDQTWFIFQHHSPYSLHTTSINVTMLGFYW